LEGPWRFLRKSRILLLVICRPPEEVRMAHQGTERPGAHFDYAGLIRFRFLKDLNHRWTLISQEEAERTESRNDGAKKWRQKDFNADAHPHWPPETLMSGSSRRWRRLVFSAAFSSWGWGKRWGQRVCGEVSVVCHNSRTDLKCEAADSDTRQIRKFGL